MKFLIIIPAHNEEENILMCLKSLENQDLIKIYEVFDCRQDPEKIENISK